MLHTMPGKNLFLLFALWIFNAAELRLLANLTRGA
jgi:hypothetical protein